MVGGLRHEGTGRCCICGISAIRSLTLMGRPVCHDCELMLSKLSCESSQYAAAIERLKGLWEGRLGIEVAKQHPRYRH